MRSWVETEQAHLLRAYSIDFLVDAIEDTKSRCLAAYDVQAAKRVAGGSDRLAA